MTHPAARFWNRGQRNVPATTGAARLLEAQDVPEIARALGLAVPFGRVLDVGCGTGRVSRHCQGYMGVDIARDAVRYCLKRGLLAHTIDGPADLDAKGWVGDLSIDLILCMSVFTHIDEAERRAYLEAFAPLAHLAIVDTIPGAGNGDVGLWTCRQEWFEQAAAETGWTIKAQYDKPSPEGVPHRYHLLERQR